MTVDDFAPDRKHVHDGIDAGLLDVVDDFMIVVEQRLQAGMSRHHLRCFAAAEKSGVAVVSGYHGAMQFTLIQHFRKHELFFAEGWRRLAALPFNRQLVPDETPATRDEPL